MRRLTTFVFLPDAYNYILGTQDAYNVQMFIIISSLGIGFVVKLLTTKHRCFCLCYPTKIQKIMMSATRNCTWNVLFQVSLVICSVIGLKTSK